jgi:hypothetical protein
MAHTCLRWFSVLAAAEQRDRPPIGAGDEGYVFLSACTAEPIAHRHARLVWSVVALRDTVRQRFSRNTKVHAGEIQHGLVLQCAVLPTPTSGAPGFSATLRLGRPLSL